MTLRLGPEGSIREEDSNDEDKDEEEKNEEKKDEESFDPDLSAYPSSNSVLTI